MSILLDFLSNVNEEKSMVEIILFFNHLIQNSKEYRDLIFRPYLEITIEAILNVIPIVKNLCYEPFVLFLMNFMNQFL